MTELLLNRRAVPRKAIRLETTLVCRDVTRQVQTLDLGRDGICLLVSRPIAPGSRCTVTFDVPSDDGPTTVTAAIRVVYSSYSATDEFKIGAHFVGLEEGVVEILKRFSAAS